MGRNPKPAAEKLLTGASNRPIRASNANKTAVGQSSFAPPAWLTGQQARAIWKQVVPQLQSLRFIQEVDRNVLGRYCQHFADWIKATKEIQALGMTVLVKMTNSEERMPRLNPSIRVRDILERQLVDIEDRFGMSTLARYRIISQQAANLNAFGDLFDRGAAGDDAPKESPVATIVPSPIGVLRGPLN